jgi:dihydrofolate reductase
MKFKWDKKLEDYVNALTDSSDTILLGRKMTDGFVSYWESVLKTPESIEYEFAKKMVNTPKIVFTKTMEKSNWNNTILAKGELKDEIRKLKEQKGKDIIVYGGTSFVQSLINEKLIDDYHLFINPAAIGQGKSIFAGLARMMNLDLRESTAYECGLVVNRYTEL